MSKRAIVCSAVVVVVAVGAGVGGAVAGNAAPSAEATTVRTLFIRDTSQALIDLGEKGAGHGDLFTYHGRVFTHEGGKAIGRFGGSCHVLGASANVPEDWSCNLDYILPGGQLFTGGIIASKHLFSGNKFAFGVLGGTGVYRDARGEGTMRVPPEVKNQTDGYVVLNLR